MAGNTDFETGVGGTTGHAFGGSLHTADTLANLNALISDDTLAGLGSTNTWTEAQTFSTGVILNPDAVFIFPTSSSVPSISSSGQAIWDSTHTVLIIANGSSGRHFIPSEGIAGQGSMDTAGALTINADHSGSSHINLTEAHSWSAQQTFTTGINLTAGQLIFPATAIDAADDNTLDDYEEGTFTPVLMDNSLDGTGEGQVYVVQRGRYVKIGRLVSIAITLTTSTVSSLTLTEQARIGGLPFTSADLTGPSHNTALTVGHAAGLGTTTIRAATARVLPNVAYASLELWDQLSGVTSLLISEWSSNGQMALAGFYEV